MRLVARKRARNGRLWLRTPPLTNFVGDERPTRPMHVMRASASLFFLCIFPRFACVRRARLKRLRIHHLQLFRDRAVATGPSLPSHDGSPRPALSSVYPDISSPSAPAASSAIPAYVRLSAPSVLVCLSSLPVGVCCAMPFVCATSTRAIV